MKGYASEGDDIFLLKNAGDYLSSPPSRASSGRKRKGGYSYSENLDEIRNNLKQLYGKTIEPKDLEEMLKNYVNTGITTSQKSLEKLQQQKRDIRRPIADRAINMPLDATAKILKSDMDGKGYNPLSAITYGGKQRNANQSVYLNYEQDSSRGFVPMNWINRQTGNQLQPYSAFQDNRYTDIDDQEGYKANEYLKQINDKGRQELELKQQEYQTQEAIKNNAIKKQSDDIYAEIEGKQKTKKMVLDSTNEIIKSSDNMKESRRRKELDGLSSGVLKEMIKDYNKTTTSKIRGYAKMSKTSLIKTIIQYNITP